jgi:hypothetical protein
MGSCSCRLEVVAIWVVCAGNGHRRAHALTREWRRCNRGKEQEWMRPTVSQEKDWAAKRAPTHEKKSAP